MVAIFAMVGLIIGILVGLFNPSGAQRGGEGLADQRAEQPTTTAADALPDQFFTAVLASIPVSRGRSAAEARAQTLRDQGVRDVGVLSPRRYATLADDYWAVYSGVFSTPEDAVARCRELKDQHPDTITSCYSKNVSNEP